MATTTINGLTYPVAADDPNPADIQALATTLDTLLVPRFATTTARDTAIPSPTTGYVCYVTSTSAGANNGCLNVFNGSSWIPHYRSAQIAYKGADESVTSNTTAQADDHLVLAVEANRAYAIEMWVMFVGAEAGDLKYNFSYPAGASVAEAFTSYASTSTSGAVVFGAFGAALDASTPTADFVVGAYAGNIVCALINGFISVGATAGNLTFNWAQGASSGTATTIYTGSWMKLTRAV